jgi:zinc transport system ATP-binding protein
MINAIDVEHLYAKLGQHDVLMDIQFKLATGAFLAIVGPNGAGKSTLLKCILGLIAPTAGTAKVFDNKPGNVSADTIGYVPQLKTMDRKFPALAIELVLTGINNKWPWRSKAHDLQKGMDALQQVGAEHLANRSLGKLSGGELQRVCLARSLVRQPKLVMLDEPTTGIDAVGERDFYLLLENYQKKSGATFVMITHDWHAATHHADHVLLLNRKQISFGPPKEALGEENLRLAFGHVGHQHSQVFGQFYD